MFVNLSRELFGIGPSDGVTHQESSYGKRRDSWAFPGMVGEFQKKCLDLKAGETHVMADIEGPGLITRMWMTLPRRTNPGALRNLALKIYWDGEEDPSVLTPLGDLFGTTFARPREYVSAYTAITSGAYLCFFPMPFCGRATITVENQSRLPVHTFFYQVTYLKLEHDLESGTPYFHCLWHRETMERKGPPFTVLDANRRGYYMGCHLDMQGRGYPWRLNPLHIGMPEGYGLGMLEGWERIWIDGSGEPCVHGTGGEDYFNGAWYFTRVPSISLTHGVTQRRYDTRRVSCYRFHTEMPVQFNECIKVTIDHGLNNLLPAVYDGTAYWYQEEPHAPFDDLPEPGSRRPVGTALNRLIMTAPILYGATGIYAARKLGRRFSSHR
jgi:hypothetical protein